MSLLSLLRGFPTFLLMNEMDHARRRWHREPARRKLPPERLHELGAIGQERQQALRPLNRHQVAAEHCRNGEACQEAGAPLRTRCGALPDYRVFPLSGVLLQRVSGAGSKKVSVRAFNDRTGRTAFYAIRFLEK